MHAKWKGFIQGFKYFQNNKKGQGLVLEKASRNSPGQTHRTDQPGELLPLLRLARWIICNCWLRPMPDLQEKKKVLQTLTLLLY